MPTLLTEPQSRSYSPEPPRKRWTRGEYYALEEAGVLNGQHLELIEGELISKMGKNRPRVIAVTRVFLALIKVFGEQYVNQEAPIDVSAADNTTNEPEPDVIVLNRDSETVNAGNPGPGDLHLAVEVSDTTLTFDLTVKASLYARAGIIEYWVVDVRGRRLIVHRSPQEGKYASVAVYGEHETVSPVAAPGKALRIQSLL